MAFKSAAIQRAPVSSLITFLLIPAIVFWTQSCSDAAKRVSENKDKLPPQVLAVPPAGSYNETVRVQLLCNDEAIGSGCDQIFYSMDPRASREAFLPFSQKIEASDDMTLRYFAQDKDGNQSEVYDAVYLFDYTAPRVTATSPKDGALFVGSGIQQIQIQFDESINPDSVTPASVTLHDLTSQQPVAVGDIDVAGAAVTVRLASSLNRNREYEVRLSDTVTDIAGNPLAVYSSVFYTQPDADSLPQPGNAGVDHLEYALDDGNDGLLISRINTAGHPGLIENNDFSRYEYAPITDGEVGTFQAIGSLNADYHTAKADVASHGGDSLLVWYEKPMYPRDEFAGSTATGTLFYASASQGSLGESQTLKTGMGHVADVRVIAGDTNYLVLWVEVGDGQRQANWAVIENGEPVASDTFSLITCCTYLDRMLIEGAAMGDAFLVGIQGIGGSLVIYNIKKDQAGRYGSQADNEPLLQEISTWASSFKVLTHNNQYVVAVHSLSGLDLIYGETGNWQKSDPMISPFPVTGVVDYDLAVDNIGGLYLGVSTEQGGEYTLTAIEGTHGQYWSSYDIHTSINRLDSLTLAKGADRAVMFLEKYQSRPMGLNIAVATASVPLPVSDVPWQLNPILPPSSVDRGGNYAGGLSPYWPLLYVTGDRTNTGSAVQPSFISNTQGMDTLLFAQYDTGVKRLYHSLLQNDQWTLPAPTVSREFDEWYAMALNGRIIVGFQHNIRLHYASFDGDAWSALPNLPCDGVDCYYDVYRHGTSADSFGVLHQRNTIQQQEPFVSRSDFLITVRDGQNWQDIAYNGPVDRLGLLELVGIDGRYKVIGQNSVNQDTVSITSRDLHTVNGIWSWQNETTPITEYTVDISHETAPVLDSDGQTIVILYQDVSGLHSVHWSGSGWIEKDLSALAAPAQTVGLLPVVGELAHNDHSFLAAWINEGIHVARFNGDSWDTEKLTNTRPHKDTIHVAGLKNSYLMVWLAYDESQLQLDGAIYQHGAWRLLHNIAGTTLAVAEPDVSHNGEAYIVSWRQLKDPRMRTWQIKAITTP